MGGVERVERYLTAEGRGTGHRGGLEEKKSGGGKGEKKGITGERSGDEMGGGKEGEGKEAQRNRSPVVARPRKAAAGVVAARHTNVRALPSRVGSSCGSGRGGQRGCRAGRSSCCRERSAGGVLGELVEC